MPEPLSPLRDPTAVKSIIDRVDKLTKERLDIDKKIVEITYFAKDNSGNFSILDKLGEFRPHWTQAIDNSRDVALKYISTHLVTFVDVRLTLVERITTMEQCKRSIHSLTKFAQEESPLVKNPLQGIDGVAKILNEIWSALGAESLAIANLLAKVEEKNLKKTIQTLTKDIAPVKIACGDIGAAVDKWLTFRSE